MLKLFFNDLWFEIFAECICNYNFNGDVIKKYFKKVVMIFATLMSPWRIEEELKDLNDYTRNSYQLSTTKQQVSHIHSIYDADHISTKDKLFMPF